MKPPKPFCRRFTAAIQDGGDNRDVLSLTYFAWTFGTVFQCLLQILTVITYLLYISLSHLKHVDVYEQNNVKHLCYVAETLSQACQVTQIQQITTHFSNNCIRCTMHSNKVLKSLQIWRFWWRSLCAATVILVFICDIKTIHKPKPVLGHSLKPVWTNWLLPYKTAVHILAACTDWLGT